MPSFRAYAAPLCISALATAAVLTGCASRRFSSQAPPGVSLAGDWKLDPSRSDDLGRALTELRAQDEKRSLEMRRRQTGGMTQEGEGPEGQEGPEGGERPEHGGRGSQRAAGGRGANPGEEAGVGRGPHVSAADELLSSVPQGDYLRITAGANAFTVTAGASSDQYTPGMESEISAQQGEATQISGWKGADYVIDTRPQWGAEIIQSYGLTKDGKLSMTVRLTGRGIKFAFTRLYERTTRAPLLAPPTND
jgi:hypothetical protein